MAANTLNQPGLNLSRKQNRSLERSRASSSAPWNKPNLSDFQVKDLREPSHSFPLQGAPAAEKPNLKLLHSLKECLQLLRELAVEVNDIRQGKRGGKRAAPVGGSSEPGSLETSRSLILQWAEELERNMPAKKGTEPTDEKTRRRRRDDEEGKGEKTEEEEQNDKLQGWAMELRKAQESNSVSDEELKKLLYSRGPKGSQLACILPLLEFVAWSLLSEDTEEAVSMRWLPTKQKAWRTGSGSPRYIPDSVWQWIRSASVPVQLDVGSSPSRLSVSSDRLQVQEALARSALASHDPEWPYVLGDVTIAAGRHYWEVEVSPEGGWRIGVMSESAARGRRCPMCPERGYWALWRSSSGLWAGTEEPAKLQRAAAPRLLGVYVDVGEGQVSFYDVERSVHIYTFSDTFGRRLVPVFGHLDRDTVLRIRPAPTMKM